MKNMTMIDLAGQWSLSDRKAEHNLAGSVPGCVHADLLAAGAIPDPYYRDNETSLQWIGEMDWSYKRTFEIPPELLERDRLILQCEGLDTFASIHVNGKEIARTNNMFRSWEFDLLEYVQPGKNEIEIWFESTIPYMNKQQEEQYLWHAGAGAYSINGRNWVRKEQCNYGWDWGPSFATCGIWRPIRILGFDTARLDEIQVLQDHNLNGTVDLQVSILAEVFSSNENLSLKAELTFEGVPVAESEVVLGEGRGSIYLKVENPELWWPNGMGAQSLYQLDIVLTNDNYEILDQRTQSVGLRSLDLVREMDEWGQSFKFRANGIDFFAKGANWIPADTFDARVSDEDLRDLLESAVESNMNCIRVWGGGLYERDSFYDICDELGLCVWQDFMFACAAYPAGDVAFLENVRIEAEQNVKRLRSHPCIALWCGNNELEQIPATIGDKPGQMSWKDYSRLFDELLAEVVKTFDPERAYWPSSEHTPIGERTNTGDPGSGDAHCWSVWHGGEPFEWYRTSYHRFCSEFGFQSFAHPATSESYTLPEERNITSYVMEHHQKCPMGNSGIIRQMLNWFRLPVGFANTIWLSHILQALAIKYAVEHWRQNMPRCMGAIYWQLNDCWPVASWSSIDSEHRWKALHYEARRFFARHLISGVEDSKKGTVEVHVTSDSTESIEAKIQLHVESVEGDVVYDDTSVIHTPVNGSKLVRIHDLSSLVNEYSIRDLIVTMTLEIDGQVVSRNMVTLTRPKHLNLRQPDLSAELIKCDSGNVELVVRTDKPALWVWLDLEDDPDVRFSDNFFHLRAGEEKQISFSSSKKLDPVKNPLSTLRIRDLTTTYE